MGKQSLTDKNKLMLKADEGSGYQQGTAADSRRVDWWREARFGMFVHWGPYSLLGGMWKGEESFPHPEWIMRHQKISVKNYAPLVKDWMPEEHHLVEWVRLASETGMKYLVVTAKHHDGFAMFDSPSNPYNIVAATPWGKDPMKILARECKVYGIKLCFYYSQSQDWHDPNGLGNDWDFPSDDKKDFQFYLDHKVKPQLRELLTQYGEIGLIWFDTPMSITQEQSLDLKNYVRSIQNDCLVCGRIGNNIGDYGVLGDHQLPAGETVGDWEVPATLNKNWGFRKSDEAWKTPQQVIQTLTTVLSKGCNYLLNVGPDASGKIPIGALENLKKVGPWVKANQEAIYQTQASPYLETFPWGSTALKGNQLFLYVIQPPKDRVIELSNLITPPQIVRTLSGDQLTFQVRDDLALEISDVTLSLPHSQVGTAVTVVVLDFKESPKVDARLSQLASGQVLLPAFKATLHKSSTDSQLTIDQGGVCDGWLDTSDYISWRFYVRKTGTYKANLFTCATKYPRVWGGGHVVELKCAGQKLKAEVKADGPSDTARALHLPEATTNLGQLSLEKGWREIFLHTSAINISENTSNGLTVSELRLVPN